MTIDEAEQEDALLEEDPAPPTEALAWVDPDHLTDARDSDEAVYTRGDLLRDAPRRFPIRPGIAIPLGVLGATIAAYAVTTAVWPLHNIAPTAASVAFEPVAAAPATVTWPGAGNAAVGIDGLSTIAAHEDAVPMASLTKVITALAALEALPLAAGEQGPAFSFGYGDSDEYWRYREENQSALDVPVEGSLTEYQMLQGILMGSANNYADRLSDEIWGSDPAFVSAGEHWLAQRNITGIELANPSGFEWGNIGTPRALIEVGKVALGNPVIGEIVATKTVELPGAGVVDNTNKLLGQEGYIGIKTGTIGEGEEELFNLLTAKEVAVGDTTVRILVAVVGQPDDDSRYAYTQSLYAEVEAALQAQEPTIAEDTVLGTLDTVWGEQVDIVAKNDTRVVLWNGATAAGTTRFALGDDWAQGADAGTVTVTGPLDTAEAELVLAEELRGPSFWWRLTHPLELFGLSDDAA